MKSFLSVDLDYWGLQDSGYKKSIVIFLNKIVKLKKQIETFSSHEEMLSFLNCFKLDHIYQVDFHSDICESEITNLDEGTWANFYKYRKNCTFEWRYPSYRKCFYELMGRCDSSQNNEHGSHWPKKNFPYKKVIRRKGINYINWDSIVAVGISISKWWYDSRIDFVFEKYEFLKKYKT